MKNLAKLRERSHRLRQERFVIEGLREFSMALENGFLIEEVYVCPDLLPTPEAMQLVETAARYGAEVTRLSWMAFEKVTARENPDGVLAVAQLPTRVIDEIAMPPAPLIVVVDGVEKPGNIGAMIRTAEGVGAAAVVVASEKPDLFSPQIIRNSRGLVFSVPVVGESPNYLRSWLQRQGLPLVATTPTAQRHHWDADYSRGAAVLMGAEHTGLSDFWLEAATESVRVPLLGKADSLNVAATAAIILYEALRQRQTNG